jgi:hypothetical protein
MHNILIYGEKLLDIEPIFIETLFKSSLKIIGQFGHALDIAENP